MLLCSSAIVHSGTNNIITLQYIKDEIIKLMLKEIGEWWALDIHCFVKC